MYKVYLPTTNFTLVPSAWTGCDNECRDGFTEAGAYLIASIDDLKLLRERVNAGIEPENKYYRLEIDMNLTQETIWESIGYVNPFKGHFDGSGRTIYVTISRTSSWTQELLRIATSLEQLVTSL